jgi:hypothetical protein
VIVGDANVGAAMIDVSGSAHRAGRRLALVESDDDLSRTAASGMARAGIAGVYQRLTSPAKSAPRSKRGPILSNGL